MTQLIDRDSLLVGKGQLNLFSPPNTQVATEKSIFHVCYPRESVPETSTSNPISFHITGIPDFLDLRQNLLKVKFQIKNSDGTDITDAEAHIAPITYIGNTFIKQLRIFMGNKIVYDSQDTYFYRAYLEALINYSRDVKDNQLVLAGWYRNYQNEGENHIDMERNIGYMQRKMWSKQSRIFETYTPLHADIFNQSLYLLPKVDMRIEIFRNPSEITLVGYPPATGDPSTTPATMNANLHIKSIEWHVRRVEVNKSLALTIEKMLLKDMAIYPIKRTVLRTLHIPSQSLDVRNLLVYNGQLPTSMILTFVESGAYHGDLKKSPFYLHPYNVESAQAVVGGKRVPSEQPLEMDFTNNRYTESYFMSLNNCGFGMTFNESNNITYEQFRENTFFLAFDFRTDQTGDASVDLLKFGETRLYLKFRAALTENIKIIAYLSFDNILGIDNNRNAIMDYSN